MRMKNLNIINKKSKVIYILVEVYKREFISRAKIKKELESKGYIVVFGHKDTIMDGLMIGLLPPGIILDKCAQTTKLKRGKEITKRGSIFCVLDEEGIHTFPSEVRERIGDPREVDLILFNNLFQQLLTKRIYKENNLQIPNHLITGNPRISDSNFIKENEFIKRKKINLKNILLVGNYYDFRKENEFIEHDRKAYEVATSLIKYWERSNLRKKYRLIYRPHPGEKVDLENTCKKFNVEVDYSDSIQNQIKDASIVITSRCTVSIESILKNKIVMSFRSDDSRNIFTRAGTFRFTNLNDIINYIDKYDKKELIYSKNQKKELLKIKELFSSHFDSIERICNSLIILSDQVKYQNKILTLSRSITTAILGLFTNNLFKSRRSLAYKRNRNSIYNAMIGGYIKKSFWFIFI